jgi:hypothetical protein
MKAAATAAKVLTSPARDAGGVLLYERDRIGK